MTPVNCMRNVAAGAFLCALAACAGERTPETPDTISRDAFVGTYVELRMAALRSPDGRVDPSHRDEILAAAGVTDADMLEFVDVNARRVQLMVEVWGEIDDTMRVLRTREATPAPTPVS